MSNPNDPWELLPDQPAPLPRWTPPGGSGSGSPPPAQGPVPERAAGRKGKRSVLTSRPAVSAATGVVGLILGLSLSASDTGAAKAEAQDAAKAQIAQIRDQAREDVAEAKSEMTEEQQTAIDDAVATAVAAEKARRSKLIKEAVAKAVKDTKAELKSAKAAPKAIADASPNDPRFGTCGEANAAGYGNYRRGVDPEYDWYQDRDGDGVVCER